jgi:hypothetical protein
MLPVGHGPGGPGCVTLGKKGSPLQGLLAWGFPSDYLRYGREEMDWWNWASAHLGPEGLPRGHLRGGLHRYVG